MKAEMLDKAKKLWGVEFITQADQERLNAFVDEFRQAVGRALFEHPELSSTDEFKRLDKLL